MTQTQKHPQTPHLRDRAQQLLNAFDALPAPESLTDILRTARRLMVLDRLLTQLWKAPASKAARQPMAAAEAPSDATRTESGEDAEADIPSRPLNRRERRAQAARDRSVKPRETG